MFISRVQRFDSTREILYDSVVSFGVQPKNRLGEIVVSLFEHFANRTVVSHLLKHTEKMVWADALPDHIVSHTIGDGLPRAFKTKCLIVGFAHDSLSIGINVRPDRVLDRVVQTINRMRPDGTTDGRLLNGVCHAKFVRDQIGGLIVVRFGKVLSRTKPLRNQLAETRPKIDTIADRINIALECIANSRLEPLRNGPGKTLDANLLQQ